MPSVSRKQQQASVLSLLAKRGKISPDKLYGSAKQMYDGMSEEQLRHYAETKTEGLPEKVAERRKFMRTPEIIKIAIISWGGRRAELVKGNFPIQPGVGYTNLLGAIPIPYAGLRFGHPDKPGISIGSNIIGYSSRAQKSFKDRSSPSGLLDMLINKIEDKGKGIVKTPKIIKEAFLAKTAERGEGIGQGGEKQLDLGADKCKCPKCGHVANHDKGVPCNTISCPKCGTKMVGV